MSRKKKKQKEERLNIEYSAFGGYSVKVVITEDIVASINQRAHQVGTVYKDREPLGLFAEHVNGFDTYIFLKPTSKIDTIVHECFHFVVALMKGIGSKLGESSEEVYAYHLDDVVLKVFNFVKKKRKKFKQKEQKND